MSYSSLVKRPFPVKHKSIGDYLDNFLALGGECAFVQPRGYRTVRWSYKDVADTAFQFARELQRIGTAKGDRVLIWGPNSAEWVSAFYGCAVAGVVAVPIDDVSTGDFARKVFVSVGAKLLVCSREKSQVEAGSPTLLLDDLRETLRANSPMPISPANIDLNDALEIVFTSGTTSEPKGVVITHGNVLSNVQPLEVEIGKYLKYERFVHPVRFLNLLPLSHVFGQFLGIFLPQLMGGTVVFQETLKPSEIVATIRHSRVSVLVAVPRILQSLKEHIERDYGARGAPESSEGLLKKAEGKHFLRRWWIFRRIRTQFGWKFWAFICGGAALDSETETFWNALGYAVIQGYGLTETTSLISVNHPFKPARGSIGKVMTGREVRLGADGEIMVRGGGVSSSYWDGNGLRPVTFEEGWYRTGDIGELDASGNLHFKGRTKEVIVTSAGMKIYPADLEAALRAQSGVKDCAVIDLPLEGNAEPCAVLILKDGNADAAAAVACANQSLAEYQRMRRWYVWPEEDFPRTATQKLRKNAIREKMLTAETENSGTPARNSVAEIIDRIVGRTAGSESPTAGTETELTLSSLDQVALISALEDRYQMDLGDAALASVKSIGDIEKILQTKPEPRVKYHFPDWVQQWSISWIRLAVQYVFLRPAVFLLARPHVYGTENLDGVRAPALIICNHISDVDLGLVIAALPPHLGNRLAIATAGEELEGLRSRKRGFVELYSRMKWYLAVSLLNLFPLPRRSGFQESFAYAGKSVDRGYSILVFPEGGHTVDGELRPFRAGVGLLAKRLNVPVVPMRIRGLFEVKHSGRRFARPGEIAIHLGEPVVFENQSAEEIAHELQRRVGQM